MKEKTFAIKSIIWSAVVAVLLINGCIPPPPDASTYAREPDNRPHYTVEQFAAMKKLKLGPVKERVGLIIAPGRYETDSYTVNGAIQEDFEMILSSMDDHFNYVYYTPSMNSSRRDVLAKVDRCLSSCGKNSLLTVFLAGNVVRAGGDWYLVCYDTAPGKVTATAVSLKSLFAKLENAGCGRILVFADIYPVGDDPGDAIKYLAGVPAFKAKYDLTREMRMLLTNYSPDGKPYKFYVGFQGADIFSWYLTLGLRGQADRVVNGGNKDGRTTVDELVRYLSEELSGAMVYKQKIYRIGNFSPETVVIK